MRYVKRQKLLSWGDDFQILASTVVIDMASHNDDTAGFSLNL